MMRIPRTAIYTGDLKPVYTTVSNLMSLPVGSTCLYLTPDQQKFIKDLRIIEKNKKGSKCVVESLKAINLKTDEVLELARVTVSKTCVDKVSGISRSPRCFSASPSIFGRCRVGTTVIYEYRDRIKTRTVLNKLGAKAVATTYHLLDIKRGITKPLLLMCLTKQGRGYKNETPNSKIYSQYF